MNLQDRKALEVECAELAKCVGMKFTPNKPQPNPYPNVIDVHWTKQDFWLEIEHDGNVTWDTMQAIKNDFFGENVTCVEVYPAQSEVINAGNYRHLWRTPNIADFC